MPISPPSFRYRQVQIDAAGEEQPRHVLVRGVPGAGPDAVDVPALTPQLRPQRVRRLVVVQPGRVAHNHVHLAAGERDGAHEVARVVGPDVVTPLLVEALHRGDGGPQRLPLRRVVDVVVVQRERGILAAFDVRCHVAHQRVEVVGPLHEADGKDKLRALVVTRVYRNVVLGEHVPRAKSQLQRVAQVDGDRRSGGVPRLHGVRNGRPRRQRLRRAG